MTLYKLTIKGIKELDIIKEYNELTEDDAYAIIDEYGDADTVDQNSDLISEKDGKFIEINHALEISLEPVDDDPQYDEVSFADELRESHKYRWL